MGKTIETGEFVVGVHCPPNKKLFTYGYNCVIIITV